MLNLSTYIAAATSVTAYSPDEARDNHGEWTDGGNATEATKSILTKAGLKVLSFSQIPPDLKSALHMHPPTFDADTVSMVKGVVSGLDALKNETPESKRLMSFVKNTVPIVLASFDPNIGMVTSINEGQQWLSINTNVGKLLTQIGESMRPHAGVSTQQYLDVLKQGGSHSDAVATALKFTLWHELGHVINNLTDDSMYHELMSIVSDKFGPRLAGAKEWLETNLSSYAVSSPHEAVGEITAKVFGGLPLPRELDVFKEGLVR